MFVSESSATTEILIQLPQALVSELDRTCKTGERKQKRAYLSSNEDVYS